MSATKSDYQVASLAAGFSIGFGFLTVWEALKQTRLNKNPLRSSYIYMLWGEIAANLTIAIIAWLFLDNILGPTVPVLFFILFLWVFEVQLLMQIIINRIAVIAESQQQIARIKWGTVLIITVINILVFCIWIPAHLDPPVSQTFVNINEYWDRLSKVLILLVDAGLNWYFLKIVKDRLLQQHGLVKYKPLVSFNAKLMVVSILMDGMLIGLMSLPNQVVYIQFHPVAYMVKLNIEMSMASLITRLARGQNNDVHMNSLSETDPSRRYATGDRGESNGKRDTVLKSFSKALGLSGSQQPEDTGRHHHSAQAGGGGGIQRTFDVNVTIQESSPTNSIHKGHGHAFDKLEDEIPFRNATGHSFEMGGAKELDGSSHASTRS